MPWSSTWVIQDDDHEDADRQRAVRERVDAERQEAEPGAAERDRREQDERPAVGRRVGRGVGRPGAGRRKWSDL